MCLEARVLGDCPGTDIYFPLSLCPFYHREPGGNLGTLERIVPKSPDRDRILRRAHTPLSSSKCVTPEKDEFQQELESKGPAGRLFL